MVSLGWQSRCWVEGRVSLEWSIGCENWETDLLLNNVSSCRLLDIKPFFFFLIFTLKGDHFWQNILVSYLFFLREAVILEDRAVTPRVGKWENEKPQNVKVLLCLQRYHRSDGPSFLLALWSQLGIGTRGKNDLIIISKIKRSKKKRKEKVTRISQRKQAVFLHNFYFKFTLWVSILASLDEKL